MANQRIVDYIRNGLSKGYPLDSLKQALLNQGWGEAQVNEAVIQTQKAITPSGMHAPPQELPARTPGERPIGVTVISILGFLISLLAIIGAAFILFIGSMFSGLDPTLVDDVLVISFGDVGTYIMVLGMIPLVVGIIGLIAFFLLLKMKRSGWFLVVTLGIISIITTVVSSVLVSFETTGIITLVVWIIIIAYLFMKRKIFA
ncbi:MAG: hypothetical protein ABIH52_02050 [Candidatus Aenigmatarchaeota archaeon]|nr:hypothetical protein [Nanoarchaeota archaeon]